MINVGIYARISSERQRGNTSIDTQIADCKAYAKRLGWTVYDTYIDEAESGRKTTRAQLQRLRSDIKARRLQAVLVWKTDRLARQARDQHNLMAEFEQYKVIFASATEELDLVTSAGRFSAGMLAQMNQLYSDILSERVTRALKHKAEYGGWVGPVPLGYQRDVCGALIPSEDAPVIRIVFKLYATGAHSYTSIADHLNSLGFHTLKWQTGERGLFGRESVRTILRNNAYCGIVTSGGCEFSGNHEPLVSEELWEQCASIREERSGSKHSPAVQTPALLMQRAQCVACGDKMWIHRGGKVDLACWYYRCSGNNRRTCSASMVRIEAIDQTALGMLHGLTIPQDWIPEIRERVTEVLRQQQPGPVIDRAALDQQLRRYALIFAEGMISEAEYTKKREHIQSLQAQAGSQVSVKPPQVDRAMALLADLGSVLDQATIDEQRMLLRAVFATFWIGDRAIKAITPTSAFLHLVSVISVVRVADGFEAPSHHYAPIWTARNQLYVYQ
jgi:site-specific DNA recombinase